MVSNDTITINATDVTGQRRVALKTRRDATVGELIGEVGSRRRLFQEDAENRPITWHARDESRGVALRRSQIVGEALRDQDSVRLQPEISAGRA